MAEGGVEGGMSTESPGSSHIPSVWPLLVMVVSVNEICVERMTGD